MAMFVADLFVYPVKACAGIRVDEALVLERGFANDRRWMIVDGAGKFLTQREVPKLALVKPRLAPDRLMLSTPDGRELTLPLGYDSGAVTDAELWGYVARVVRHETGSAWFSNWIERPASLVYMPDTERRPVKHAGPSELVSFADGYPFLLVSGESLDELNRRLERPLEIRRFRPNIVIRGGAAHAEDAFGRIRIGSVGFQGTKRCERCSVTTVDPETGERGLEPLRTLATYRREAGKIWFGINLVRNGSGILRVGDRVEPNLER